LKKKLNIYMIMALRYLNLLYKYSPHIQGKSETPTTLILPSIIVVGTALHHDTMTDV
jgi:hypothetical protein